jgi:hypothetical protein
MFFKHALEAGMEKASEGAMEFFQNPQVSCLLRLKDALSESFWCKVKKLISRRRYYVCTYYTT